MTVSAMQTLVSQILTGASTNTKWDATTAVLPALNTAQLELVNRVLGYSAKTDRAYDLLSEVQASKSTSVDTTGYALSGVASDPGPFMHYVASYGTIDNEVRWVSKIPFRNLAQQNNDYLKGNDERPMCYIFTHTYYLIVDSGSYPITTVIYYIREPKELVASGASGYQVTTCELNSSWHRTLCKMAAAECHRFVGDESNFAKYQALSKEADTEIGARVMGVATDTSAQQLEAWRKDA